MDDLLRVAALRSALLFFVPALTAQAVCHHLGSVPVPASWTASPVPLGCSAAPTWLTTWPAWHLFTPPHRAPAPHPGFNPGHAVALPRLLVSYRCTGLLLVPVVPAHVRTMGYVIDRAEVACVRS